MRESYIAEEGSKDHKRVLLVAHDWGSTIAFRLASEAPQLADRFIIVNSFHVSPSGDFREFCDAQYAEDTLSSYWPTHESILTFQWGQSLGKPSTSPTGPTKKPNHGYFETAYARESPLLCNTYSLLTPTNGKLNHIPPHNSAYCSSHRLHLLIPVIYSLPNIHPPPLISPPA